MAITYNQDTEIFDIIRYNSSTGEYYGIAHNYLTKTGDFDYFPDDATAGDYIAFGWFAGTWSNLVLNVGTALAATDIEVVWEYINEDGSWDTLTVTDGTNGFTTTGTNTVSFDIPSDWRYRYLSSSTDTINGLGGTYYYYSACYIRCRIVSVTGLTEGGANTTDVPTAKNNALMLDGGDYTLDDIETADTTNGWGIVTRAGKYFNLKSHLIIGDKLYPAENATTATSLTIKDGTFFELGTEEYKSILIFDRNTTLTLGEVSGDIYYDGCFLYYWNNNSVFTHSNGYNTWYGDLKIYNSTLFKLQGGFNDPSIASGDAEIINSQLAGNYYYFSNTTGTLKNTVLDMGSTTYRLYQYSSGLEVDNAILSRSVGVAVGRTNTTISNIDFGADKIYYSVNSNIISYAKDCSFDDLDTQTNASSTNTQCNIQYTLDLNFKDEEDNLVEDVNVRIIDSQDNILHDGVWSDDLIVLVYQKRTISPDTGTTNFNPINIWVSKNGYEPEFKELELNNDNRTLYYTLKRKVNSNQYNTVRN